MRAVEARDVETALRITPRFYPAALGFDLWPEILKDLCEVFDARASNLNVGHIRRNELLATAQYGVPQDLLARWLRIEDHLTADPRLRQSLHLPNRPLIERQLISEAEWHASQMYREVFEPFGFDSTLAAQVVIDDEGVTAVFGFIRGLGDAEFTDDDVARFHLYLPHFREAMRCAARVHCADARSDALASVFEGLRAAAIVTDRFGSVRYANNAARAFFAEGDGVTLIRGHIGAADRGARAALREAILRAVLSGGRRELVRLPRRERSALLASVARAGTTRDLPALRLMATVFVLDPEARYEGDVEALQRLFGLTRAEAEVMAAIAEGRTPREAAAAFGRAYETVRVQLKAVYGKTGARSQADLVGLARAVAEPAR